MPYVFETKHLKCLEINCKEGITVELLKHLGHDAIGTDIPETQFTAMHRSQELSVHYFWPQHPPFPYASGSFDIVFFRGALGDLSPIFCWPRVVKEMCRISKNAVIILLQIDDTFDRNDGLIPNQLEGWECENLVRGCYKYSKIQPASY